MEENKLKKSNRGGARPGSGRKKIRAKYYGFAATKEVYEILEAIPGSKTDFINACILKAAKMK